MITTVGQLLLNDVLPPEMRNYGRVWDKNGIREVFDELARKHPDKYREAAKRLSDLARESATMTGGYSFGVTDLVQPPEVRAARDELAARIRQIRDSDDPDDVREKKLLAAAHEGQAKISALAAEIADKRQNPLAQQVRSGSRGNKSNLNSLLGADLLYTDHRDRDIPIPVLRNYSQGLTPAEYFAGSFGARRGVFDTKSATQNAGYLAKQLVQAAHRLVVTADDDETPYDESQPRGLPVDVDDPDNEGALLAHPVGKYPRNTLLTPRILKAMRADGVKSLLVRSPLVGGPADGGVYSRDLGERERGGLPPIGDYAGIAAAQSISEPLTQSQLSSKHSGGVAGATAKAVSGFKAIDQQIQVPKTFAGGAAHAQLDGVVQSIREAPQGGHYLYVGGQEHYAPSGADLLVKAGDTVEAGDVLSDGTPNPAEIVRHKGVGEGRRYFVQSFRDILRRSGVPAHRRNIELLARGLINHVRLTDELGDWSPDDVLPYQYSESQWQPRKGTITTPPKQAVGRYLERPVLHYSVGTPIRPSVVKMLDQYGVKSIAAHPEPPPFQAEMLRGMTSITEDPDWMTRMLGGYQQDSFLEAARRGGVSDTAGTSFVPALAQGEGFGQYGATKAWTPADLAKPQ